jgi:hypothetical protein
LISQRYRWMRGTMQVFGRYLQQMRPVARQVNWPLDLLMMIVYPVDVYVIPALGFFFWGSIGVAAATGLPLELIFSWILAVILQNVMISTVYIISHDDEFMLLPYAMLLDIYQSLMVNSAWIIALLDELRGARMRWS